MAWLNLALISVFVGLSTKACCYPCLEGWSWSGSSCLKVFNESTLTFLDAESECLSHRANLASVHSDEEAAAVYQLANDASLFTLWMGLFREEGSSRLNWTDGSTTTSVNLEDNVFSGSSLAPICALIHIDKEDVEWTWSGCEMKAGFICKWMEFYFEENSQECPQCNRRLKRHMLDLDRTYILRKNRRGGYFDFIHDRYGSKRREIIHIKPNNYVFLQYFHEEISPRHNISMPLEEYNITALPCSTQEDFYRLDSCYHFDSENLTTWEEAESSCQERFNGSLVAINNWSEFLFIISELEEDLNSTWIGMRQNNFSWSNNQFILYPKWWDLMSDGDEEKCATNVESVDGSDFWEWQNCSQKLSYLCEYESSIKVPPTPSVPRLIDCPEGWISMDQGKCLRLFIDPKTWTEAVKYCDMIGAKLYTRRNFEEFRNIIMALLSSMWNGNIHDIWIGLFQEANSTILTVDGQNPGYKYFKSGYHKNILHRYCFATEINWMMMPWKNICQAYLPFVCEGEAHEIKDLPPPAIEEDAPKCPIDSLKEWFYYDDACYNFVTKNSNEEKSWWDADLECRGLGGMLASIHSFEENYWISKKVRNFADASLWIGGFDNFLKMGVQAQGLSWIDGTPFDWVNWEDGEPNQYRMESCIQFYVHRSGYWNDQNCSKKSGYICKKALKEDNSTVSQFTYENPEKYCSPGWWPLGDRCFKLFTEKVTFTYALQNCQAYKGGQLISIRSREEQDVITAAVGPYSSSFFIGLVEDDGFVWVDQSAVTFTYWNAGEPNGQERGYSDYYFEREGCVEMLPGSSFGRWNDIQCDFRRNFICQRPPDSFENTAPVIDFCSGKFSEFASYREGCYKLFHQNETWEGARKVCQSLGADLVTIEDTYQQTFLKYYFSFQTNDSIWIGLMAEENSEIFKWTGNWPVLVSFWGEGEPANMDGEKRCITYSIPSGTWSVDSCDSERTFICTLLPELIPTPDPPHDRSCPTKRGWFDFGGSNCYYVEMKEVSTWNSALGRCYQKGGTLASIHSEAEMKYIKRATYHVQAQVWIGLHQLSRNVYGWTDGTSLQYTHWARNEPNNDKEKCVEMQLHGRQWNDLDCMRTLSYICKIHKDRLIIEEPTTTTSILETTIPSTVSTTSPSITTTSSTSTTASSPSPLLLSSSPSKLSPSSSSSLSLLSILIPIMTPTTTQITSTTTTTTTTTKRPNSSRKTTAATTLFVIRMLSTRSTAALLGDSTPMFNEYLPSTTPISGAKSPLHQEPNGDASLGMSGGGIAGLVILFLMVLFVVTYLSYSYLKARKEAASNYDNVFYGAKS